MKPITSDADFRLNGQLLSHYTYSKYVIMMDFISFRFERIYIHYKWYAYTFVINGMPFG